MSKIPLEQALHETIDLARGHRWAEYRSRLGALREALDQVGGEEVRRHLEILSAAAPEHDAEGCIAELEALRRELAQFQGVEIAAGAPALDLRGLQPPEPIVRILQALERSPDEPLRVILPHEPVPLYDILRQRGFRASGAPRAEGGYELLIEAA